MKPSVISLPKGAGSLEGLGESFEPQLNTGGSTYGVSIAVSPGRAGLTPSVRLGYNSNAGNGIGGIGWTLEFMSIKRQTDKGFPVYAASDTFVLGGEELVPLTDGTWRCENESGFQRIRQIDADGNNQNDAWEVTEKNGTRHTLGRYHGVGGTWSAVEHPEKGALPPMDRTYCWMLDSTTDLHGNRIEYTYTQGTGLLYPARISWSHLDGAEQVVSFQYEPRPDAFDDYRPTYSSRLDQRLTRITVSSQGQPVRSYGFEYAYLPGDLLPAEAAMEANYANLGVTLLRRVVQYDRSGNAGNFLPPLVFTYTGLNLNGASTRSFDSAPDLDLAQADGKVQLADLDGDALPDIFSTSSSGGQPSQWVCLNRGESGPSNDRRLKFTPQKLADAQTPASLGIPETVIQDAKGKGLVDLTCLTESGGSKRLDTFRNRTSFDRIDENRLGFELTENRETLTAAPAFVTYSDAATRLSDVNFDKRSDFVFLEQSGNQWLVHTFFVGQDGRWQNPDPIALPASFDSTYGFEIADGKPNPCTQLADMNGDRMTDLVCLTATAGGGGYQISVRYWPLCGLGRYAEARTMPAAGPVFTIPSLEAAADVYVEDFTGDGLADVLYVEGTGNASQISLRVNLAGSALSAPYTRDGLPKYDPRAASDPTVFRTADLNGNGSTDLLFRNTSPDGWQYFDFLPSGRANLLRGIDNSLGKRMTITYGTSVEDEQAARESGHPWRTHAPIVLHVVRRITMTCSQDLNGDGQNDHAVAEFRYRDPFYDGLEREFRGFSYAQRVDFGDDFLLDTVTGLMNTSAGWDTGKTPTGQVSGPSLVTRYRFHTGANDQVDNDSYPVANPPVTFTDEYTETGGREEEVLKGRQLVEEKVDPRVLHGAADGGFDAGCDAASTAATEAARGTLTPDAYVYTRAWQTWTIRRLYRPTEALPYRADQNGDGVLEDYSGTPAVLTPAGRFNPDGNGISVMSGAGRSVSFAFASKVVTQVHEANGLLSGHLGYPVRAALNTLSTFEQDDYGNETMQRDYGVDGPGYDDERFTTTSYAFGGEALTRWIVGQPDTVNVTDENGAFVSRKQHFYDGAPFAGLASGQIGARALLHRTREFRDAAQFVEATRSEFDQHGNITEMRDPVGNVRRIAWDATFKTYPVTETVVVGGGSPDLTMNAEYDFGFGTVTAATDFNGNRTDYRYDAFARLVKIIKPGDTEALPTLRFEYQPADPVRSTGYVYDAIGNLTLTAVPPDSASRVITHQREVSGQAGEFITATYVDGCGKALAELEEGTAANTWIVKSAASYNLRGGAKSKWLPYQISAADVPQFGALWPSGRPPAADGNNPYIVATDVFNDPTGREIRSLLPPETWGGARRESATRILPFEKRLFDEEDLLAGSPHGDTPHVQYADGLGRLIAVEEVVKLKDDGTAGPLATWRTAYGYDLNDQLTRIQDSQNNVKTLAYDGLKRLTFMNDPDRGTMTYIYDDASNLRETLDAKGQRIRMTYDGANRIKTEDYLDARGLAPDVSYFYDAPVTGLDFGHGQPGTATQTKGQLAWVRDLSGETHFSYDARGRLTFEVKRIPDADLGSLVSWQTGYEYDAFDRVTAVRYPDGDRVEHRFNDRGLLQRIVGGPSGDIISAIGYKPSGQLASVGYGNGVTTGYSYDPRQRLTSLLTQQAATQLINFAYQFDGASNITRIDDNRTITGPRQNTQVFSYDSLYRLTRVVYPAVLNGAPGQIDYRYDRIGNMLAQTSSITHEEKGLPVTNLGTMESGGTLGRSNRTGRAPADPPGPHALSRITGSGAPRVYDYDANGNMLTIDGLACTWDFKDRLIAVENAEMRAEYTYDYTDRRITKKVTGSAGVPPAPTTTAYINRYFEVRDYDRPVKYIWQGETRVARVTGALTATATRTQKLRLKQGWNLVALSVAGTQAQLDPAAHPLIDEAVWWNAAAGTYTPIRTGGTSVPAGAPAWLYASVPAVITFAGPTTPALPPASLTAGGQFIANVTGDAWTIPAVFPSDAEIWDHLAGTGLWLTRLSGPDAFLSDPAVTQVLPGESIFVRAAAAASLNFTSTALQIRYYHQDHLGSSSIITDAAGRLVEETANYPFGHPRSQYEPAGLAEPYGFTQKERDGESGLHNFEARYLAGHLSRFARIDPLCTSPKQLLLSNPQYLNGYSYGLNRPTLMRDDDGRIPLVAAIGIAGGVVGAISKGVDAYRANQRGWDVAKAAGKGFVSGAIGSMTTAVTATFLGGIGAGAAGGFVEKTVDSLLDGKRPTFQDSGRGAIIGAFGGLAGKGIEKIPGLKEIGRRPELFSSRKLAEYGKNALRQVGQELIGSGVEDGLDRSLPEAGKSASNSGSGAGQQSGSPLGNASGNNGASSCREDQGFVSGPQGGCIDGMTITPSSE